MSGRVHRRSHLRAGGGILASLSTNVPSSAKPVKTPPKTLIVSRPDEDDDDVVSLLESPCSTMAEEDEEEPSSEEEDEREEEDDEDSVEEDASDNEDEFEEHESFTGDVSEVEEMADHEEEDSFYDPDATDTEGEPDSEEEDDLELAEDDRRIINPRVQPLTTAPDPDISVDGGLIADLLCDSDIDDVFDFGEEEVVAHIVDDESANNSDGASVQLQAHECDTEDDDTASETSFNEKQDIAKSKNAPSDGEVENEVDHIVDLSDDVLEDDSFEEENSLPIESHRSSSRVPVEFDPRSAIPDLIEMDGVSNIDKPVADIPESSPVAPRKPIESTHTGSTDNHPTEPPNTNRPSGSLLQEYHSKHVIPLSVGIAQPKVGVPQSIECDQHYGQIAITNEFFEMGGECEPFYIDKAAEYVPEMLGDAKQVKRWGSNAQDTPPKGPRHNKRRPGREGVVKRGKWKIGSKIGTGAFGVVHVGMNMKTGALMAVKSVQMERAVMKDVRVEIGLLKSLKHTNIVRYFGAEMDSEHLHIFQEWVPGGSVTSMLSKFGPFSLTVVRSYLLQILEGLAYLHNVNVMHRDIKGSNILVNDEGVVKLADFGASKRLRQFHNDMMFSLTMRGTPYFMAPEVFEEKYSAKADVWSVGCVAVQMATGSPPWKSLGISNPVALFQHLKRTDGPPDMRIPVTSSTSDSRYMPFEHLLSKCFLRTAGDRPSANELLSDPFFAANPHSDEEYSESTGLFSPSTQCSWECMKSPLPKGRSPARRVSERRNSAAPPRSLFVSPPLPKSNGIRSSPLDVSPQPDSREWPTWARQKHKVEAEARNSVESKSLSGKFVSMMDSLALSDDTGLSSGVRERHRESSGASLRGLLFVETPSLPDRVAAQTNI